MPQHEHENNKYKTKVQGRKSIPVEVEILESQKYESQDLVYPRKMDKLIPYHW